MTAPSTPKIYTLSLHDALPIFAGRARARRLGRALRRALAGDRVVVRHGGGDARVRVGRGSERRRPRRTRTDRKSTRLNSSHVKNSYAVFCLKKKNRKVFCFAPA